MNSIKRIIPPKRPRLVMEGETVSTTERAANLRQLLYPDNISNVGSSTSTHNDSNSSHMDGPLAEDLIPDIPDIGPIDETPLDSEQRPKKTQTGEILDQFIPELPRLLSLILAGEASEDVGMPCSCGQGLRLVQCHDCFKYETSCEECFIRRHYTTPFHWPKVWQAKGFFKKMDIACLRRNTYAIDLCSRTFDRECPNASEPHGVTIVDSNGVHATRIRYCFCEGFPNYTMQLMRARLFPGTIAIPRTIFTFRVLDEFQEHHLASKKAAYDYVGALQRLSDGAFTLEVPDPYSQFVMAIRVWRHLCLLKWSGQAHDLGSSFPHRTPGSLVLFCPACPEDGYNMEVGWERTPEHLKHLNQEQLELDGNFHLQQLEKKKYSDPNDISLETANGIGYFPDEDTYREYQKAASDSSEKSTCSFLNIVNNQNKSKFKNMKITGVVNVVCSHSIIRSSVNLPKGEAHKFTDFALAHAHSHTRYNRNPLHLGVSDRMLSYDCNCQYCVKLEERFDTHFPELNAVIGQTRCSIPALHIEDHKDRCKYEFNSAYIPCSGHFYGENIEATWVESNQLGPATRQMNHGNRIGTITLNYTYWNWLKITRMHLALLKAYKEARELFQEKRQSFLSLCVLYSHWIPSWVEIAQNAPRLPNGIVQGIYEHIKSEGMFCPRGNKCINNSAMKRATKQMWPVEAQMYSSYTKDYAFNTSSRSFFVIRLRRLSTTHDRERIRGKLTLNQTETVQKDIQVQRTKLAKQIAAFRDLQTTLMPHLADLVAALPTCEVENEVLYLPSDVPQAQHVDWSLVELAEIEMRLREGDLYDALHSVRAATKAFSVTHVDKRDNSRGVKDNTRSSLQLKRIEKERDSCIADFNRARQGLIRLNYTSNNEIREMTVSDTFRRNTFQARKLGDSRRTDGQLFTFPMLSIVEEDADPTINKEKVEVPEVDGGRAGTQMPRRKRGPRKKQSKPLEGNEMPKTVEDGWIWSSKLAFGVQARSEDLASYEEESDRIQWFRAKEEMERWREVCEKVQAEFRNCIRAFSCMSTEWAHRAELKELPSGSIHTVWTSGHAAYARRQAEIYAKLLDNCKNAYKLCSFTPIPNDILFSNKSKDPENPATCTIFADTVARIRAEVQVEDDTAISKQTQRAAEMDRVTSSTG
ncbi:hypothetical protein EV360DRAFT_81473 [Lentinula raphanica]|nr:hypothetical protein EV360DRAFT_81473 [Lentinula raphanica]